MMHRGYWMFGGGALRILGFLLILVAGYFLIKYFTNNKGQSHIPNREDNALNILRERYAKGEIDEEEYRERLRNLEDD